MSEVAVAFKRFTDSLDSEYYVLQKRGATLVLIGKITRNDGTKCPHPWVAKGEATGQFTPETSKSNHTHWSLSLSAIHGIAALLKMTDAELRYETAKVRVKEVRVNGGDPFTEFEEVE